MADADYTPAFETSVGVIQSTVLLTTALIADAIKARVTQIIEVYDSAHRIKTTATFYCRFRVMHHLNAPPHFHKIKKKKIEQANQPTNQPTHVPRTESLEHRSSPPATATPLRSVSNP